MHRSARALIAVMAVLVTLGIVMLACASAPAGNEIQAKAGQEFTITIESNPTTGYQWELAQTPNEAIVKFVKSDYEAPQNGRPGQGGEEVWTFKAVGKGTAQISMRYVRSWEKDQPPAKTQTYTVVVK
ncbi:MAG: protease inhibitor I42 family protein [Chloroflexi bacterium]|nr:protease inhibitor I42 family protein [Chloroflexota bacterium]MBM3183070.1 protease inhibitor I42 family protein [Chloroflexota bacterium]MBM4452498.1 protease inhibitor I42 family protein [Chloroflexota bacterium]MBM4453573.1 protease inhibitor I42 family protein [Chloroflexota bacterium]